MANATASGDFDSLVRQYWESWNGLLGGAGSGASAGAVPGMDAAALDWFGRIQRLAAQFADGGGSAGEVARAWRELLGGEGADPFALLRTLPGVSGNWLEQVRPLLDALLRPLREQQSQWLRQPAFGPAREHQERLQALALAWQEWERHSEAYAALLGRAGQRAFEVFERRLAEHDAPGKRLESARALFDLWIDAAEEAWAELALSAEYRHAYAAMTNAQMRVRLGLQREVEQLGALLGLPGRSELDAVHRKVAELERALHAARRAADAAARPAAARDDAPSPPAATRKPGPAGTRASAPAAAARSRGPRPARRAAAAAPKATVAAPARASKPGKPSRKAAKPTKASAPAAKAAATRGPSKPPARAAAGKAAATRKKTAARTPAPASAGKVVSMREWVSRNLAAPAAERGSRRGRGR